LLSAQEKVKSFFSLVDCEVMLLKQTKFLLHCANKFFIYGGAYSFFFAPHFFFYVFYQKILSKRINCASFYKSLRRALLLAVNFKKFTFKVCVFTANCIKNCALYFFNSISAYYWSVLRSYFNKYFLLYPNIINKKQGFANFPTGWNKASWFIEFDSQKPFNNLNYQFLLDLVWLKFKDYQFFKLFTCFLRANYALFLKFPSVLPNKICGLSCLLSNFFLYECDLYIKQAISPRFNANLVRGAPSTLKESALAFQNKV
jgi:hypothetical protein